MRRHLVAAALLVQLAATPAAGGMRLSWSECGPTGTRVRTFACNTNSGTHEMVASFDPQIALTAVYGAIGIIDLCLGGVPLAPWWQFINAGSCRPTALTALTVDVGSSSSCADYWQGQASASLVYQVGYQGWDSARIVVSIGMPVQFAVPMDPGTEYHAFTVRIRNTDTVGPGACGGCTFPACIVLNEIVLLQPPGTPGGDYFGITYSDGYSNYLMWQANVYNCPFIVPVKNRTWGGIKSLYR